MRAYMKTYAKPKLKNVLQGGDKRLMTTILAPTKDASWISSSPSFGFFSRALPPIANTEVALTTPPLSLVRRGYPILARLSVGLVFHLRQGKPLAPRRARMSSTSSKQPENNRADQTSYQQPNDPVPTSSAKTNSANAAPEQTQKEPLNNARLEKVEKLMRVVHKTFPLARHFTHLSYSFSPKRENLERIEATFNSLKALEKDAWILSSTKQLQYMSCVARVAASVPLEDSKNSKEFHALFHNVRSFLRHLLVTMPISSRPERYPRKQAALRIQCRFFFNEVEEIPLPPKHYATKTPQNRKALSPLEDDLCIIFDQHNPAFQFSGQESEAMLHDTRWTCFSQLMYGIQHSEKLISHQAILTLMYGWDLEYLLRKHDAVEDPYYDTLRTAYHKSIITHPYGIGAWFKYASSFLSTTQFEKTGRHLFVLLVKKIRHTMEAFEIWKQLPRDTPAVSDLKGSTSLLRAMLRARSTNLATEVALSMENSLDRETYDNELARLALKSLLYFWTSIGNLSKASKFREQLLDSSDNAKDVSLMAFRTLLDSRTLEQGMDFYHSIKDDVDSELHDRLLEAIIVKACRENQVYEAEKLFAMRKLTPTPGMFVSLIRGYAERLDVENTFTTVDQFSQVQSLPVEGYNALMMLYFKLHDIEGIQHIIKTMEEAGLSPDLYSYSVLMNAFIEAGRWREALDTFGFLLQSSLPHLRPNTVILNMVLKTSIAVGSDGVTTFHLFRQMASLGIMPNTRTFVYLINTACISGDIELAEDIFDLLDKPDAYARFQKRTEKAHHGLKPDVYVFTCMMYGYLRLQKPKEARACLAEMSQRGIQPTGVTFAVIIASYLQENVELGLNRAMDLANSFLRQRASLSGYEIKLDLDDEELADVFVPIIRSLARQMSPETAIQYCESILSQGVKPSMLMYTALLKAYCEADDVESALKVWGHMRDFVGSKTQQDLNSPISLIPFKTILCEPLTNLIGSLGERFDLILKIWNEYHAAELTFDASNWNALGRAACKAGELGMALWISEFVLSWRPGDPEPQEQSETAVVWKPPRLEDGEGSTGPWQTRFRLLYERHGKDKSLSREQLSIGDFIPDTSNIVPPSTRIFQMVRETIYASISRRHDRFWFTNGLFIKALQAAILPLSVKQKLAISMKCPKTMEALGRLESRGANVYSKYN